MELHDHVPDHDLVHGRLLHLHLLDHDLPEDAGGMNRGWRNGIARGFRTG